MSSYKIFLTKSSEVAFMLSDAARAKITKDNNIISTGSGSVQKDCRIPEIYHGKGYFYCIIEYKNGEDWNNPKYDLIIA